MSTADADDATSAAASAHADGEDMLAAASAYADGEDMLAPMRTGRMRLPPPMRT